MNYGKMLQSVKFFMIAQYSDLAKKNGVTINNTKRTDWYMFQHYTCGALYWIGKNKVRLKGIFVHPDHRGKGFGDKLTKGLIERALEGGVTTIEAHVFSTKWYVDRGFKIEKKFKTKDSDGREFWKVIRTF